MQEQFNFSGEKIKKWETTRGSLENVMHMFTYSNTLPKMENNLDTREMYTAWIKFIFPY